MNKTDFISLIEQPDTLGKNHIPALKNIAADFPYFQSAQLLLTKALYNEKHYEFEKQLKYASLMVPDRAVFFRYIHNLTEAAVQQTAEMADTVAVMEPQIEDVYIPEPTIPEVKPVIENTIEPAPEIPETPSVEKEPEEPVAQEIIAEPVTVVPDMEAAPEPKVVNPNETHSFMEWLHLQTDQAQPADAQQETTPPEHNQETIKEMPPEQTMQEQIAGQVERSSNVSEFESILDKFIRENPRISRGKAEFYSPMNMAKQSVEQDEELVSETLANVYYKQGHYKKAIRVYEKLCLLYPHKLTYFADLIQKIKTENKD